MKSLIVYRYFMPIEIKASYSIRVVFEPGILGIWAVDIERENKWQMPLVGYHRYICAN